MTESSGARDIWRGVARALIANDHAVLGEVPLCNGRRADMVAIDRAGTISLIEIKSCRADFVADCKWYDYLDYSDRFYFAVGSNFPRELLPAGEGLILADRFGGEIVRAGPLRALNSGQRKAMLICFARVAAGRLNCLLDPQI
jgi:hypothetical protein